MPHSPKQHRLLVRNTVLRSTAAVSQHCVCEQVTVDVCAALLKLFLKKEMHF